MKQSEITPDEALKILREGNARFVADAHEHPHLNRERRGQTASQGQKPFAAVLSCSDSRVPVELIFDRGIGDLFVVRVAGNVVGNSELASIEYAVEHLGAPLVVVLGHTKCGAVTAVVKEGLLSGNLRAIARKILPAVQDAKRDNPDLAEEKLVLACVKTNVWKAVADAFDASEALRHEAKSASVKVVAAVYDVQTGEVDWMGPHPEENRLWR
jgi:carbonic anhydrase